MTDVAIVGASGHTGGELLRLLLQHPHADVVAATSRSALGKPLQKVHPNLRGHAGATLRFGDRDDLPDADVIFTCLPHGESQRQVPALLDTGATVIDLGADFRLDAATYETWYGRPHDAPALLDEAVYGLAEATRRDLPGARLISGVGCFATAMNLALLPMARAGLLDDATVIADGKIGSSAAGAGIQAAGMHAARSRSLRLYAPTQHRHAAEVARICGVSPEVSLHSVELVRGVLATMHVLLPEAPDEKSLWRIWRDAYQDEPFVRIVKESSGIHRGPDPKLVTGSNFADVGFHAAGHRIVATCALDNLVKGAAGSAVQAMNLAVGHAETAGLTQLPVHPQ